MEQDEVVLAELSAAFESFTGSADTAERERAMVWFRDAWPRLRERTRPEAGIAPDEKAVAVYLMTPFLVHLADWPALAEQSRIGRDLARGLGRTGQSIAFTHHLGIALQHMGDDQAADQAFAQAERDAGASGDRSQQARSLAHRGQLRRRAGRATEAADLLHHAVQLYRQENNQLGEARTLGDLAAVLADLGDDDAALRYAERSRDIFHALGSVENEARAVRMMAGDRAARGDVRQARDLLDEAVRLFDAVPAYGAAAEAAFTAARLLRDSGDRAGAVRYASRAFDRAVTAGDEIAHEIGMFRDLTDAELAFQDLLAAGSDVDGERIIAGRPALHTDIALFAALQAERDEAADPRVRAAVRRLTTSPRSAARRWFETEWNEVVSLAGSRSADLPHRLAPLVREVVLSDAPPPHVLQQILTVVPADAFPGVHGRYLRQLAAAQANDRGSPDALETAALTAERAATLLRRAGADEESASALVLAAASWRQRRTGDRQANADRALAALRQALLVYRRRTHPREWASTISNLANVYWQYPRDRRRNLIRAARRHAAALTVFTVEQFPHEHGTALSNLGLVLSEPAMAGDPENLERARRHLVQALDLVVDPAQQATVLLNLSRFYRMRVHGDPDANLDLALRYARRSYELYSGLGMPLDAGVAATAVADAIGMSGLRDGGPGLTEAAEWYSRALQAVPAELAPLDHAAAADNLANTLAQLPDPAAVFDETIALHETAIELYREFADAAEESRARYNLAGTLGRQEPPDHDRIIRLYAESMAGRPVDEVPLEWAEAATELARALVERDRPGDGERAVQLLRQTMGLVAPDTAPSHAWRAGELLGRALARRDDWPGAADAFRSATAAAESRYLATVLSSGQQAELTRMAGLPREAAYALARCGRVAEAVQVIEGARARDLGRLLERDRAELAALHGIAPAIATGFRDAVGLLAAAEARQRVATGHDGDERRRVRALLTDARARVRAATTAVRSVPGFADFGGSPPDAAERAARGDVPLVYLITAEFGSVALVVGPDGHQAVTGPLREDDLVAALAGADTLVNDDVLNRVLDVLGDRFLAALAERLVGLGTRRVTLIAAGLLAVLPVHAARYRRDGAVRHLMDDVDVAFTPSARTLLAAGVPPAPGNGARLVGVAEPLPSDPPLPGAAREMEVVRALFPGAVDVLTGRAATRAVLTSALPAATHVHLACHGSYDVAEPMRSSLALAGGEQLTLRELFDGRRLDGVRLAVASACETAVTDITHAQDEAVGFPAGLVYAGAATVVGTLWSVHDRSAALVMSRFYVHHFAGDPDGSEGPMTVARAMCRAQCWLRDASAADVNRFAVSVGLPRLRGLPTGRPPFADRPAHWAPFVVVGHGGITGSAGPAVPSPRASRQPPATR